MTYCKGRRRLLPTRRNCLPALRLGLFHRKKFYAILPNLRTNTKIFKFWFNTLDFSFEILNVQVLNAQIFAQ